MRLTTSGMYYAAHNEWSVYMDIKDKGGSRGVQSEGSDPF